MRCHLSCFSVFFSFKQRVQGFCTPRIRNYILGGKHLGVLVFVFWGGGFILFFFFLLVRAYFVWLFWSYILREFTPSTELLATVPVNAVQQKLVKFGLAVDELCLSLGPELLAKTNLDLQTWFQVGEPLHSHERLVSGVGRPLRHQRRPAGG